METVKKVNVAPSSDSGHYIEKAKQVINLDEVNETFFVEGESFLVGEQKEKIMVGPCRFRRLFRQLEVQTPPPIFR